MYPNVEAEIARNGITKYNLAKKIGVTPSTLCLKLSGKSNILLSEAMKIKALLKTDIPIEELFQEEAAAQDE